MLSRRRLTGLSTGGPRRRYRLPCVGVSSGVVWLVYGNAVHSVAQVHPYMNGSVIYVYISRLKYMYFNVFT